MSDRQFEDLYEIGLILAIVLAFGVFLLYMIDLRSPESNVETVRRFIIAMISVIAPTSTIDLLVSVSVAVIGGITVSRESVIAGVIVAFFLYGIVSFAIGWFTAPV